MDEVGEVERLAEDEEAGIEGVADLQLGVLGRFHDELQVAHIAKGASAVRLPRDKHVVADTQVFCVDVGRCHRVGAFRCR